MTPPPIPPSDLPPPEPPDQNGARPELNLAGLVMQVVGIQTFLAEERGRAARKAEAMREQRTREQKTKAAGQKEERGK